ncbi:MAG: DUF308 domain-containing protein [Clostridiales Family XIII bacterium]|jgi:uncharacterized membrane protein HdeD (DUF308 family)|nr:DUF308 domain-containing protein [Clostridiales Family XIII bacterium]
MRIIMLIAGLVPIAAGIFFLINEGQTFVALAFVAGITLLAFGLLGALAYCAARRSLGVPGWVLADGLLALVLSAVTLQNRIQDDDIALSVFGVWSMALGAACLAGAADMSNEKAGFRIALAILGLMNAAMGAYGFFRPFLPALGMTGILGGIFILQGVSVGAVGAGLSRKRPVKSPGGDAKVERARAASRKNGADAKEKTPSND